MQNLWIYITARKNNPLFWPPLFLLWLASLAYRAGLIIKKKSTGKQIRLNIPVISVGNLTVGGSGKTPMVVEIARYFQKKGKTVGIASSGYGRSVRVDYCARGMEIADTETDATTIDNVGDEVMMMARILPEAYFAVCESKSKAAGRLMQSRTVDLIIIDDGFQHRRLYRDFDLLVADAAVDLRHESLFPLGRMRESLQEISRADAVVLTKANLIEKPTDFKNWLTNRMKDKIMAEVEFINDAVVSIAERRPVKDISDKRIYFFAGIASFETFASYLRKQFPNIAGFRRFNDHCRYSRSEPALIRRDIAKYYPEYIITTYKDYVKIDTLDFGQPIYYLDLRLNFKTGGDLLFEQLEQIVKG